MTEEIERKFLLERVPAHLSPDEARTIEQGYLALEAEGQEVRLRRSPGRFWLTVKTTGELERQEYETELTEEQFLTLWPATAGRRLQKKRYLMTIDGYQAEIDQYIAPLQGLVVAEIEFPTVAAAQAFRPPEWLGREVTHLSFLKNRNLLQFDQLESLMNLL